MTWTLILTLAMWSNSATIESVYGFTSQERCIKAGQVWAERAKVISAGASPLAICVVM